MLRQQRVHRRHADGDLGRSLARLALDRLVPSSGRIGRASHDDIERRAVIEVLLVRHVELRLWFPRRAVLPNVADHADDRHRLGRIVASDDDATDRIASVETPPAPAPR